MTIRFQPAPVSPRERVRARRAAIFFGALAAGAAGLSYVGVVDPHDPSSVLPQCPIHWATGLNCPGCGGLRMTHDLLHGDIARAFADNAFLLILAPVLLVLLAIWASRWLRGGRPGLNTKLTAPLLVSALAWCVVRNIAGW